MNSADASARCAKDQFPSIPACIRIQNLSVSNDAAAQRCKVNFAADRVPNAHKVAMFLSARHPRTEFGRVLGSISKIVRLSKE